MSKHIGRFEIIRELGRGAQSVVYPRAGSAFAARGGDQDAAFLPA